MAHSDPSRAFATPSTPQNGPFDPPERILLGGQKYLKRGVLGPFRCFYPFFEVFQSVVFEGPQIALITLFTGVTEYLLTSDRYLIYKANTIGKL